MTALRFGILAPSAHNTQPWLFELMSPTKARVYTDSSRLLPRTDPPDRQIHISHGTLLEVTAIAASALGHRAEIGITPEGEVSKSDYGTRPTAEIQLTPSPSAPDPLFEAVGRRRTSRLAHVGPAPSSADIEAILEATRGTEVEAKILTEGLGPLVDLVDRAMAVEVASEATYEETLAWFRFGGEEVREKGDGLNVQTAGSDTFLARTFLTRGNFLDDSNRARFLDSFRNVTRTTQAFLVLTTRDNGMASWITSGRAYVRAQLVATQRDLHFHPVSQALEEYEAMTPLRAELEKLLPIGPPGKVQMLVRVGRTEAPAISPRRELDVMLKGSG